MVRGEAVVVHHLVRMVRLRVLVPHLTVRMLSLQLHLTLVPALPIRLRERS